jgi:PEP-CTERM motif
MIFNAAADFSTTNNPNGVWSYGFSSTLTPGAGLTLYTMSNNAFLGNPNLIAWTANIALSVPADYKNTASTTQIAGTVSLLPGELAFHPGPSDQFSFVRFIASQAGVYSIAATFTGRDFVGPTTTDVHVLDNGTSLFSGEVTGFGPASDVIAPNMLLHLAVGDTIDFAVGFGTDGNFLFDTTGLAVTITSGQQSPVSEPTSLALFGLGGLTLLGYGWRRRKQAAA